MPRPKTQAGEAHADEQVRYRCKLKARGAPEASQVDVAVAAAVAVSFARSRGKPNGDAAFDALVDLAKTILVDRGYNPVEADKKTRGRLQFRSDMDSLNAITTATPTDRSSPHYFRFKKRDSRVPRSEDGGAA
ncbi:MULTISPECIES: hypothetical protein [Rhizobiaceae]|uniref:hypothetical protein n=1 Tax=Rhizobiaceae TaxID=82115 RepID=UPI000FD940DC|nr:MULTISPECIES: hypothetical protein [Rhizobiaceae]MBY5462096.1 hypothetical protein [Rhizobium leguminosarum]RVP47338.1 hypothetical protein CN078_26855 [Sinorhizobium medicae]RVP75441.1 hypothetical protein CN079_20110 [Sinorhizobium medicae]UWU06583.1 hypothetical protein N2598_09310 [Sinorhizobium medicae]